MSTLSPADPSGFRLREYLVEPSLNRITGPEGAVQVEPRIMKVLVALASRPGEVWSRNGLLDEVWGDTVVNEETLTRAVFHLRQHLGDETGAPRFIETIRKGGYRLVCPVEAVGGDGGGGVTGRGSEESPMREGTIGGRAPHPEDDPSGSEGPGRPDRRRLLAYVLGSALILTMVVVGITRFPGSSASLPAAPPPVISFTSYQGQERYPSISPDGALVAFAWRENTDEPYDLYVKHRDAETPLRLTEGPEYEGYSTWSPGGSEVAFYRAGPQGWGVYSVPAIGGPVRRLVETRSNVEGLSWAPEGDRIAFSDRPEVGAPYVIRELDLASGTVRDLTSPPRYSSGDTRPTYSPDGSQLAFVRGDPAGNRDAWVIPSRGGEPRRITENQLSIRGLTWDPDGEHLVFSGFANGTYSIWRLSVNSGARSWLAIPGEWAYDPAVAAQAGTLVWVDARFEKNIWRVQLGEDGSLGQSYQALISSTRWDSEPHYSPDGDRIAFTSSRDGSLEIWIADGEGLDPVRLTQFEGPFVGNPRWSPDGRSLAFFATSEGFAAVFTMDIEGGRPRRLTRPVANAIPASWSRDGRWIYYATDVEEGWQIWRMRPDGGGVQRVTLTGGRGAREDGQGRWLYLIRPDRPGLWRLPVGEVEGEEGQEVVFPDFPSRAGYTNWFLQGNTFYSLVPGEGAPIAVAVDLGTGAVDSLAALPSIATPSLNVSPDGEYLLFSRIDRSESDLKLMERLVWQGGGG